MLQSEPEFDSRQDQELWLRKLTGGSPDLTVHILQIQPSSVMGYAQNRSRLSDRIWEFVDVLGFR